MARCVHSTRASMVLAAMIFCVIVLDVDCVQDAGEVVFTMRSSIATPKVANREGDDVATSVAMLKQYHFVLESNFGLGAHGTIAANISLNSFSLSPQSPLAELSAGELLLFSGSVMSAVEWSDSNWLSGAMINVSGCGLGSGSGSSANGASSVYDGSSTYSASTSSTSGSPSTCNRGQRISGKNNITKFAAALSAIVQETSVFLRVYRSAVWFAAMGPQSSTSSSPAGNNPCRVPFLASSRLPIAVNISHGDDGGGDAVVILDSASSVAAVALTLQAADVVTLAVVQCSHTPLRLQYRFSLLNAGGVEVSNAAIPYLGMWSFQTALYLVGWLYWSTYLYRMLSGYWNGPHWIRAVFPMELMIWGILLLRVIQYFMLVTANEMNQRSTRPDMDNRVQHLNLGAAILSVLSLTLVFTTMMLAGCGVGQVDSMREYMPVRQRNSIVVFVAIYFGLNAANIAESSYNNSLSVAIALVYISGLMYAVVQLRHVIETLRTRMVVAADTTAAAMAFFRLHSVRVPFGFNIYAVVAGWLLQAFLLNDDTMRYLSDAVSEFRVFYWTVVMMIFFRREVVLF